MTTRFIQCSHDEHASAILAILNDAIVNSTALYDYQPRTAANMRSWFDIKTANQFPVIGAVSEDGELMGFASYGTFRAFPAFKYSVEHSLYVHKDHRGKGLGRALLSEIIEVAKQRQIHLLIGAIDAENAVSIALHESMGFVHSGTIRQAGFKFGRWLDLAFYQITLETPLAPVDG
jgi:L-amino acid N-acyltransferase